MLLKADSHTAQITPANTSDTTGLLFIATPRCLQEGNAAVVFVYVNGQIPEIPIFHL